MAIDILLSVYGDAPYLGQFLDSLSGQEEKNFHLLYRFDGPAAPGTEECLRRFGGVETGGREHCGIVRSYQRLLDASRAEYLMFADQDDVWFPNKISRSLEVIREQEKIFPDIPLLVHSDLQVVDGALQLIHPSMRKYQALKPQKKRLRDLIVQNNVTGCSVIFNRRLAELLAFPETDVICHDWYLALTAAAFGEIRYIDEALLAYRQHSGNVFGAVPRRKIFSVGLDRALLHERINLTRRQAGAFCRQFRSRLQADEIELLEAWEKNISEKSYWKRLGSALRHGFRKNDFARSLGMWWAL